MVLACIAAFVGVIAGLSAGDQTTGDYGNPVCAKWGCDDPSRSLHAIVTGDVAGFFRYQPAMGLVSLAVRAPAVAVAHASGSSLRGEYQAGAAVCMALACLIAVWLAYYARRRGASLAAVLVALGVWLVGILWTRALLYGHPEEALAAMLAVAAIALGATRQPLAAGIALALAIATKEWALLVAPAVMFAAGAHDWRRVAVPALIGTVLLTAVMAAGNPSSFHAAHEGQRAGDEHTVTPASVWFRVGDRHVVGNSRDRVLYRVYPPALVGRWCRPFVIAFALVASLLFWRRRGFDAAGAFALAAFVLVERVIFDTQTFSYHLIPMLIAVAAWEVFARKRLPLVAVAATVALQLTARVVSLSPDISSYGFNAIYLGWTIALLVYLGVATFRPPAGTRQLP